MTVSSRIVHRLNIFPWITRCLQERHHLRRTCGARVGDAHFMLVMHERYSRVTCEWKPTGSVLVAELVLTELLSNPCGWTALKHV